MLILLSHKARRVKINYNRSS